MLAEKLVKKRVVVGGKVRSIPPEPVASLRSVNFAQRGLLLCIVEGSDIDLLLEKGARLPEQIPGAILLRFADPDIEVAADPRAGMQGVEAAHRWLFAEIIREGNTAQPHGIGGDAAIERPQKRFPAVGKVFPGVFAVEDDGDEPLACGDVLGDVQQVAHQMARGLFWRVLGGGETDEIRERAVAENAVDRSAVVANLPALEQFQVVDLGLRVGRVAMDRLEQILFVAAKILDPRLLHQRDHLGRDGALRGPQPARAASEKAFVVFNRQLQLCFGVLWPVKAVRKFPVRQAAFRKSRVVDERQDWVKKRSGGQLHLPAFLRRAIGEGDGAHDLQMDRQQPRFFRFGEVASFFAQGGDFGKTPPRDVAAPSEVEPDLEIEKILVAETPCNAREVFRARVIAAFDEEFGIARLRPNHVCPVCLEKILQERDPLALVELGSRFARALQPEIGDAAFDDFLDLQQEHRCEVEVEPHAGVIGHERDHVEIPLHAMEPHPGHHRHMGERVHIIRLVHVPKENHVRHPFVIGASGKNGNAGKP